MADLGKAYPRKAKQEIKFKNPLLQHCVHRVQASPTCCPSKIRRAKTHRALGNCDRLHEQTDFSTFSAKKGQKGRYSTPFLTYVNDLPSLVPDVSLFADDTALLCSDSSPSNLVTSMQTGINSTIAWMEAWKLRPNIAKTEAILISPLPPTQPLHFPGANANVKIVHEHKHLGVIFDSHMSWSPQVQSVCKRASSSLGMLQPHCHHLNDHCRKLFFTSYILPIFDYCDTAWCGLPQALVQTLEIHQRLLLKILFRKNQTFSPNVSTV